MRNLNLNRSIRLYEEATAIIPGGSQTMSKRPECLAMGAMPIYIEKARGCYVWDVDGNEYIDFISSLGPITLGYCYPAVDEAVKRQVDNGTIFSMMHPLEVEAAKAVIDAVPCAEMVRFLKTGAEATSAAVRIARGYTGKDLIISSGYHGWLDTWSAERPAPTDRGVPKALKETIAGFRFGALDGDDSLEAVLERHKGQAACIILEPALYDNMDTGGFLKWARELADRYEVVLIFDEIVTGFRLALGGAQEYFDVVPDIACFAKGISNGLPVAAVAGKREIMKIASDLVISSTYGGDAISLAAVVACLKEYREKDVIEHIRQQGRRFMDGMNAAARNAGLNLEFKGYPMMSSFAFGYGDPETNTDLMTLLLQEMAKRGILLRRGGLNFITYSHGTREIDRTIDTAREVFSILTSALDSGYLKDRLISTDVAAGIRRF